MPKQHILYWFDRCRAKFLRPTPRAEVSSQELDKFLGPELAALQTRYLQCASDPFRREGCPPLWRIRAGDIGADERIHVRGCHRCQRQWNEVRLRTWLETTAAVVLVIAALQICLPALARSIRAELSRIQTTTIVPPNAQAVAGVTAKKPFATLELSPDPKVRDVQLRQFPPEIEMWLRLGNGAIAREFAQRQREIVAYVGPGTQLADRLSQAWFETLRTGGNGAVVRVLRRQATLSHVLKPDGLVALAEEHARLAAIVSPPMLCDLLKTQTELVQEMELAHE